jgi:hypothetical protein
MGHRERVRAVCSCVTDTLLFAASLRLQIYRGLGIEPILDERGELDRVLVGQWPYCIQFVSPCNYLTFAGQRAPPMTYTW